MPDLPDEALEKTETKETVIAAVDALPDIYRKSLLLHYMEGMTYPEIAAFLDIPESTVTGRLQVARNRLRDELMPLVEDTLLEKRPTPQLTLKIMAALPPLLYAVPTQASLLVKTQFRKQNVEFLAINIDQDSSMRRDMVASFRYQSAPLLTFALGDLEMRKAFGSDEIPYTCIIDQNGQIRYERKGLGADFSVAMAHQLEWVIGMNGTQ